MGNILAAVCPCGYESEPLFVGCGMIEGPFHVPALCRACHQYVTVDPSRPRVRCRTCRRKPQVVAAFIDAAGGDTDQPVECPACGALSAVLEEQGCWD